ncbi:uncharacterized mitochondrial protein AtMg00810-like [Malania oleifera]|uniref:uncharacterized mitochondrial protein AtMg00810-like n=1 Tax=Malania oleifera TaxID=397392 RepID=UPI0025ADE907|nr:uncharacterized mitochondrial protein AtMg00810-like [Malania oleifera]
MTLHFFFTTGAGMILILLYVDDMIITGIDLSSIRDLRHFLSQNFEMKDLGQLNYFLGHEVISNSDGYYLSQAKYVPNLVSKAGLTNSKTCTSPLEPNIRLLTDGESLPDATLYRQLVSSLIYLTLTHPNISYAIHLVSQFMSAPRSTHYAVVLRTLPIVAPPWVIVSYFTPLSFLGIVKSRLMLPNAVLRLSIVPLLILQLNFHGYDGF